MQVDLFTDRQARMALRDNWDRVYWADPEAHYFLSWDWIDRRLATGAGRTMLLAAKLREQNADYVAFLPLKMRSRQLGDGRYWQEVVVAGSPMSDFTGLICRPEAEELAIPALAEAVLARRWGVLWLHHLRASDRRAKLFLDRFPQSEVRIDDHDRPAEAGAPNDRICPYATLPNDWEAYLASISANTRQKIRRFLRKVETSDEVRITHATNETFERDLDIIVELWARRWVEQERKASPVQRDGLRRVLEEVHQTGHLVLPILWRQDRPLAALALIVDDRTRALLFYAAGRDLDEADLPVGLILHGHSIRFAIEQGFQTYEFLRGDEAYKRSLATDERYIRNIVISSRKGGNRGGLIDPIAVPTVFAMVERAAQAGDATKAAFGCRQILQAAPQHAGALALLERLGAPGTRPGGSR